jgi:membrane fusion protein (multidrug efflux system)
MAIQGSLHSVGRRSPASPPRPAGAWWYQSRPQGASRSRPMPAPVRSRRHRMRHLCGRRRRRGRPACRGGQGRGDRDCSDDAQSVGTLRSRQGVMLRPRGGRADPVHWASGTARVVRKRPGAGAAGRHAAKVPRVKQAAGPGVAGPGQPASRNQELVAQSFVARRVLEESAASLQVAEAQLALACARLEPDARSWRRSTARSGIRNINIRATSSRTVRTWSIMEDISSDVRRLPPARALPDAGCGHGQDVELQLDALPGRVFKRPCGGDRPAAGRQWPLGRGARGVAQHHG